MAPLRLLLVAVAAMPIACGTTEPPPVSPPPVAEKPVTFVPDTKPVPSAHWVDATVPKGTVLKLSLMDVLGSGSSSEGEDFRCLVTDAILIGGTVTVPSGSNIMGVVRKVVRATPGYKGRGGMIRLEFNRVGTPTGASASLKARLTGLKSARTSAVLAGASDPGAIVSGLRGEEVLLEPTTPITVVLEEPLSIKVKE